jgi:hypothetical protein
MYGEGSGACGVLVGIADGNRPSDLGGDGRVVLTWNFRSGIGGALTRLIWLWIGAGGGHL